MNQDFSQDDDDGRVIYGVEDDNEHSADQSQDDRDAVSIEQRAYASDQSFYFFDQIRKQTLSFMLLRREPPYIPSIITQLENA